MASIPVLVYPNAYVAAISNLIAFMFIYASVAFAIYIPFFVLGKTGFGVFATGIVIVSGIIFFFGRIFYFEVSTLEIIPPFMYWMPQFPGWLRIMTGVVNVAALLIFIVTFLWLGIKNKTKLRVYYRSLIMASGMSLLFLATIVAQLTPVPGFFNLSVGALLISSGLLLLSHGIMHEHKDLLREQNNEQ